MIKINIVPLSSNSAWCGRRFKTDKYKSFEKEMMLKLPQMKVEQVGKLKLKANVGYSSKASDIDNFLKQFIDCLQKKYKFNDNRIYRLEVEKVDVKKGEEFIQFEIEKLCTHQQS